MNLSHNELQGSLQQSFEQHSGLIYIDISHNQLEGPLPNIAAFQKAPYQFLANNKLLCGDINGLQPCLHQQPISLVKEETEGL